MLSRQNCQLILGTWVGNGMEAAKPSPHVAAERSRKGQKACEASVAWWHGSQPSKGRLKRRWKEQRFNCQVRAAELLETEQDAMLVESNWNKCWNSRTKSRWSVNPKWPLLQLSYRQSLSAQTIEDKSIFGGTKSAQKSDLGCKSHKVRIQFKVSPNSET